MENEMQNAQYRMGNVLLPTPVSPPMPMLCNKMIWSREGKIVVANHRCYRWGSPPEKDYTWQSAVSSQQSAVSGQQSAIYIQ